MTPNATPSERGWLRANLAIVVTMLVLVGALTGLNLLAHRVDPMEHARYAERLRDLRDLNAQVDREMMAARLGLSRHYDTLTRQTQLLGQLTDQTLPLPAYVLADDEQLLRQAAQTLAERVRGKADIVDQFRRNNAVLLNSQSYFVTVMHQLLDAPGHPTLPKGMPTLVNRYTRQVLTLMRAADPSERTQVPALQLGAVPKAAATAVDALRRHGEVIVERVHAIDALHRQAASLQTDATIDDFSERYAQAYSHAATLADHYQQALYTLSVVLIAVLGWLFFRLERARRSLVQAHREVSERFAAQQIAEQQLVLHATAFRSAHDGITLTDAKGNILDVNPAFSRITGWSRDEVIGRNPRVLKSGYHDDSFYKSMWRSIEETGQWSGEIWNRNKQGAIYPELLSISAVRDPGGVITNFVAVFADIGHLKHQERQLKQLAFYDPLTELPNRKLLAERLASGIAQVRHTGRMMAVCLLDLDGFKPVNDTWGHEAGDRVLVEIGQRLQGAVRGGDTVARLGGDEFALLLSGLTSVDEGVEVVQRLITVVAQPLGMLPEPMSVSASIGVTLFPTDDEGPDTLLRHADQAMYQAKQAGKNCYRLFNAEEDRTARDLYHRVAQIQDAMRQQELTLYYQPKVDMRRGQVIGAEALIRWNHPQRGLMLPAEFLPQVDDDDLVKDIGNWVVETALSQLDAWHAAGQHLPVSVNIAGRHLQDPGFTQMLREALARHPEVAHLLELEVLETTALEDIVRTSRVIDECRMMGVHFALDDFGAGYSSLSYLKRLPIQTIKIDLGFVRDLLTDLDNLVIVRGVIELARAFQRQVVAEGVETAAHGRMLLQLQCDLAQGWGIAAPMPAEQWLAWVQSWQPDPSWAQVRDLQWSESDVQLTVAEIKLRGWVDHVVRAIRDERPVPHEHFNDPALCCFGIWYQHEGLHRYGEHPLFAPLGDAHRRLHEVVDAMDGYWRDGRFDALPVLIEQLLQARDTAVEHLLALQLAVAKPRLESSIAPLTALGQRCNLQASH